MSIAPCWVKSVPTKLTANTTALTHQTRRHVTHPRQPHQEPPNRTSSLGTGGSFPEDCQLSEASYFFVQSTLPETNIAPKNWWLEYYFPIGEAYFQGPC